jgi:hypothetical protein
MHGTAKNLSKYRRIPQLTNPIFGKNHAVTSPTLNLSDIMGQYVLSLKSYIPQLVSPDLD